MNSIAMLYISLVGLLGMDTLFDSAAAVRQQQKRGGLASDIVCGKAFPGATYKWESSAVTLRDSRVNGFESRYEYLIGLCQNLGMDDVQDLSPKCRQIVKDNNGVAALQYHLDNDDVCYAIGGHISPGKNMSWQLVDSNDPSLGVSLVYLGGTPCKLSDENGVMQTFNRAVTIDQICAERSTKFDVGKVVEDSQCRYHIVVEGNHGCPLECGRSETEQFGPDHVCNRKGVCRYDSHQKSSRCYCNDGWGHGNCTTQGSATYAGKTKGSSGGAIAGGLFGGFFLGLLIGGVVYWYFFIYTGAGFSSKPKNVASSSSGPVWSSSSAQSTSYVPPDSDVGGAGNDPLL
eukprot:gb/GECG01012606.1/.p1 GENE.gb/GECG01012606.1/~~gb/GECG01012606.1/.p1  ORF type:complete len:345 (+),score=39.66 gb/GECG01012606.1/:1-1035(+)